MPTSAHRSRPGRWRRFGDRSRDSGAAPAPVVPPAARPARSAAARPSPAAACSQIPRRPSRRWSPGWSHGSHRAASSGRATDCRIPPKPARAGNGLLPAGSAVAGRSAAGSPGRSRAADRRPGPRAGKDRRTGRSSRSPRPRPGGPLEKARAEIHAVGHHQQRYQRSHFDP